MEPLVDQYGIKYYATLPPGWKRVVHYTEFQELKPILPSKKKDYDIVSLRYLSNADVEAKDIPEQVLQLMYITHKQFDGITFGSSNDEENVKARLQYWERQKTIYEQREMEDKASHALNMIVAYKNMFENKEGVEYLTKSPYSGHVFLNILTKHTDFTILAENIQRGMIYIKDPSYVEKTDGTPYWL